MPLTRTHVYIYSLNFKSTPQASHQLPTCLLPSELLLPPVAGLWPLAARCIFNSCV